MRDVLDILVADTESSVSCCSRMARRLMEEIGPLRIIEIGTSYGRQLSEYSKCSHLTCVDPMYDWVPDVPESEMYDSLRTDEAKVSEWWKNNGAAGLAERTNLIIGNSFHVHSDPSYGTELSDAQLLIIDGCHHPDSLVLKDYENYRRFLTLPHYVIWDDIGEHDVSSAAAMAVQLIKSLGLDCRERDIGGCRIFFVSRPTGDSGNTSLS